jgi:flavin reductase (DIM6/NTAB) family NADH-FMN oxidoreductase RutF
MTLNTRNFRDALGQFPTGVCVVTANPEGFTPFGMTVNSFASVSLDPPLVLWSLQKDSELAAAWDATSVFAVNVLNSSQQDLSNLYARKNEHDLQVDHYFMGEAGVPVIKDAVASFECELEATHDGGDHIILVGRAIEMENGPHTEPLVFHAGRYRVLD